MAFVEAQYLNGSSVQVKSDTVGGIMVHIANLHQRFASEITVVCPDTGRDLTEQPSQIPPSVVQVVVKLDDKEKATLENLLLILYLHAQHRDLEACERAFEMVRRECFFQEEKIDSFVLQLLNMNPSDIDIETQIVRMLLHVGVSLKFYLKDACSTGNERRIKMLLSHGVPANYPGTQWQPLSFVAKKGDAGAVSTLIANKAEIEHNCFLDDDQKDAATPLCYASAKGHADVVRLLISHQAKVDGACGKRWPLGDACCKWRADIVEILLSQRADPNYRATDVSNDNSFTFALHKACKRLSRIADREKPEVLQVLVTHKAAVNLQDSEGLTPLLIAFGRECRDISPIARSAVNVLLDQKADVNISRKDGSEALHLALFLRDDSVDLVKALLRSGAIVNHETVLGFTPLMRAAEKGSAETMKLLLASKANVNHQDMWGHTALDFVLRFDRVDLAEMLRANGALDHGAAELKERRQSLQETRIAFLKADRAARDAQTIWKAAFMKCRINRDINAEKEKESASKKLDELMAERKKASQARSQAEKEEYERLHPPSRKQNEDPETKERRDTFQKESQRISNAFKKRLEVFKEELAAAAEKTLCHRDLQPKERNRSLRAAIARVPNYYEANFAGFKSGIAQRKTTFLSDADVTEGLRALRKDCAKVCRRLDKKVQEFKNGVFNEKTLCYPRTFTTGNRKVKTLPSFNFSFTNKRRKKNEGDDEDETSREQSFGSSFSLGSRHNFAKENKDKRVGYCGSIGDGKIK